jgi:DNA-binding MarR family transcriptional regulator
MNQKSIGILIIIIGIFLSIFIILAKIREDFYIKTIIQNNEGSCFLEDGTCLHADRNFITYVFGGVLSTSLIILGVYMMIFDKTQKVLAENQERISSALKQAKKLEKDKKEFQAFLAGFNEDEQKIIKAVNKQDGIKQSTLRYKTGMSKTKLSLILKSLEEKEIITKKPYKKTNKIYLREKY